MTTTEISSALAAGDLARLAALLATSDASFDELDALIRRDRGTRHLALLHLERRLAAPLGATGLARLAGLLPGTLDDGPELALLLARLYHRLAPWCTGPLPAWRSARLPPAVEVEWLRVELTVSPHAVAHEPLGERLLQALAPDALVTARDPAASLRALAARAEPQLSRVALAQLRAALVRSRVAPADAQDVLLVLAGSPHDDVAAAAVAMLAEPWSLVLPAPRVPVTALLARAGVVAEALEYCARWRLEALLRGAVDDATLAPRLRQRALELLGGIASRHEIGLAIAAAASDPLLLGPPLLVFLRAQHRLAQFVTDDEAARLAAICLANGALDAREIASLVFPARHAFAAALLDAGADDPSWQRRAELAVALGLGPQGKQPLAIGAALEAVLHATAEPRVRRAMIEALGALRHVEAEAAVLAHLDTEPRAALAALRAIGGPTTAVALIAAIDQLPLRPHRDAALSLAWHLSESEPDARAALRRMLAGAEVPPAIEANLGARASADELTLLQGALRDATSSHYLRRVAAVAGATEWPLIADLVLRVVSEVAAGEIVNPASFDDAGWALANPAELGKPRQSIPDLDRDALEAMARRLHRTGCVRPRALLDATSERDAGPLVVSALARELLERADLTDDEICVLLRMLDPGVDRRVFPAVHRMLRRSPPDVRKLVVALLAKDGADELLSHLTTLTEEDDIETVRQAVLAIGALGGRGGASVDAVTRCLDHRNMNIKKAAAEALAGAGGPTAVGKLMFWLGYHDNPGFRSAIIAALRAILGPAYAATIVAALTAPAVAGHDEPRRQQLLCQALTGVLDGDDAAALCRRDEPFVAHLRHAILAGNVALASGDRARFAAAVDADPAPRTARSVSASSSLSASAPSAIERLSRALCDDGFRVETARAWVVEARAAAPSDALARVRRFWREWCALLDAPDTPANEAAAIVVLLARLAGLATPDAEERTALSRHIPALLAAARATGGDTNDAHDAALDLLIRAVRALPPPQRLALADDVRALPVRPNLAGRDPFALLHACDAFVRRGDVDRALRGARGTSDPMAQERRILQAVFGAPQGSLPEAAQREIEATARRPGAWPAVAADATAAADGNASTADGNVATAADSTADGNASTADGNVATAADGNAAVATAAAGDAISRLFTKLSLRIEAPPPRDALLHALITAHGTAHSTNRERLVDWLEALQPLGAPRWDLGSRDAILESRSRDARTPRASDLDQPRSQPLHERLLAMQDAENLEQRTTAARMLLTWPEPAARAAAVEAHLRGATDLAPSPALAAALEQLDDARILHLLDDPRARPRLLALLPHAPDLAAALTPALLDAHDVASDAGDEPTCALVAAALRVVHVDHLLVAFAPRFAAGDFRIAGTLPRAMRSSSELDAAIDHALRHGRDALVAAWREHEIRPPSRRDDAAARAAFARAVSDTRTRRPGGGAATVPTGAERDALLRDARSGAVDTARRALTMLARDPDPAVLALLHEHLGHAHPRMRLHAHRLLRTCESRDRYLEATLRLLGDPIDDVRRTAIRTLSFARFAPAAAPLVDLLADRSPVVRRAAEDALVYLGDAARGPLRRALAAARPDRRATYQRVLDRLDADEPSAD